MCLPTSSQPRCLPGVSFLAFSLLSTLFMTLSLAQAAVRYAGADVFAQASPASRDASLNASPDASLEASLDMTWERQAHGLTTDLWTGHAGTRQQEALARAQSGEGSGEGAEERLLARGRQEVKTDAAGSRSRQVRSFVDASLERSGRSFMPDIMVHYPLFGDTRVDQDIVLWVRHMADSFDRDFGFAPVFGMLGSGEAGGTFVEENNTSWLNVSYTVQQASRSCVSVVFDVWMHTGTGHLNQDVLTLTYNMLTGQRLHLVDIFEDADRALDLLSRTSRTLLLLNASENGRQDTTLLRGTLPVVENFSSLALTPKGIRVYFQPWQVSRMPGARDVEIPLEELLPAGPMLSLWGRQED